MLSRYTLNVGPNAIIGETLGLQDSNNHPTYAFASTVYWNSSYPLGTSGYPFVYDSNSNLYQYISGPSGYISTLNSMGLTDATGTLLSLDDINDICNTNITSPVSVSSLCPSYLLSSMVYWLGSATNDKVWLVYTHYGAIGSTAPAAGGVSIRPVINVTIS